MSDEGMREDAAADKVLASLYAQDEEADEEADEDESGDEDEGKEKTSSKKATKQGVKKLGGQPKKASVSSDDAVNLSELWVDAPDVGDVFK